MAIRGTPLHAQHAPIIFPGQNLLISKLSDKSVCKFVCNLKSEFN
jgi:hypothetical protein